MPIDGSPPQQHDAPRQRGLSRDVRAWLVRALVAHGVTLAVVLGSAGVAIWTRLAVVETRLAVVERQLEALWARQQQREQRGE